MQSIEWLPVPGFEDRYEVSNSGEVRNRTTGYVRKQHADSSGHLRIGLWNGKTMVTAKVHRLVARAFIGEPSDGQEVCHSDGNPSNNSVGNLRWGTRAENVADRIKHGRTFRGGSPRLIPESEWEAIVDRARKGERKRLIAEDYGVTEDVIRRIVQQQAPDLIGVRMNCLNGHPWTDENTFFERPGVKRCRICVKANAHRKYLRRKAKLLNERTNTA